jgi:hypothetical protein
MRELLPLTLHGYLHVTEDPAPGRRAGATGLSFPGPLHRSPIGVGDKRRISGCEQRDAMRFREFREFYSGYLLALRAPHSED